MQLVNSQGTVLAHWTYEQYSLATKFAPHSVLAQFAMEPDLSRTCTLGEFVAHLEAVHDCVLTAFRYHRQHASRTQLHQAGLLLTIMIDNLNRWSFAYTENVIWSQENE